MKQTKQNKQKNFCKEKHTVKRKKYNLYNLGEWKNIFMMPTSDRGKVSEINNSSNWISKYQKLKLKYWI